MRNFLLFVLLNITNFIKERKKEKFLDINTHTHTFICYLLHSFTKKKLWCVIYNIYLPNEQKYIFGAIAAM